MEQKLKLVDAIEAVKEKLTDKEYKDILDILASIKVDGQEHSEQEYSEQEDSSDDDSNDEAHNTLVRELGLQRSARERAIRLAVPDVQINVWNGSEVVQDTAVNHLLSEGTGFARPARISPQFAAFLGVPNDTLISRPLAVREITKFVKDHNLQKPENLRVIDLNRPGGQPLKELLGVPNDIQLTFFNLQTYLKNHFSPWPDQWRLI